jgi:hypothetical protein
LMGFDGPTLGVAIRIATRLTSVDQIFPIIPSPSTNSGRTRPSPGVSFKHNRLAAILFCRERQPVPAGTAILS